MFVTQICVPTQERGNEIIGIGISISIAIGIGIDSDSDGDSDGVLPCRVAFMDRLQNLYFHPSTIWFNLTTAALSSVVSLTTDSEASANSSELAASF